jgi:hypothetical protein
MKIQPLKMLEQIEEKIAATDNLRHQAMLKNVREHVASEIDGRDVDRIMKTLGPDPQFHWFGAGYGDIGPKGYQGVRAHYNKMLSDGYNIHQHIFTRIAVDDHTVFLDGPIHIIFPGKALQAMQIPVDDADASYMFSYHSWAYFHFDDNGVCTGEDSFSDGMPSPERLKKMAPEDMPDSFRC